MSCFCKFIWIVVIWGRYILRQIWPISLCITKCSFPFISSCCCWCWGSLWFKYFKRAGHFIWSWPRTILFSWFYMIFTSYIWIKSTSHWKAWCSWICFDLICWGTRYFRIFFIYFLAVHCIFWSFFSYLSKHITIFELTLDLILIPSWAGPGKLGTLFSVLFPVPNLYEFKLSLTVT